MARRVTGLAPWKPTGKSLAVVDVAKALRGEWPALVRRVQYVAIEHGLYPRRPGESKDSYKKRTYMAVGNVLGRARRAGLLPWRAIADTTERRHTLPYDGLNDFAETVEAMAEGYRLDRQAGQPSYLIAWSEHRGLAETLTEVADEFGVPFIPAGGYDALAVRYAEAKAALDRDVPTVVLHLSDLDRDGEQITGVLARDLADLYRDLRGHRAAPEVVKIALTAEQAAQVYPGRSVLDGIQVDAMPTPALRGILREAISSRTDETVLEAVLDREQGERATALDSVRGWMA
jgi:hypothetical protein